MNQDQHQHNHQVEQSKVKPNTTLQASSPAQLPQRDVYCTPLSATADIVASASFVLNDNCQQLPFNAEKQSNNINI